MQPPENEKADESGNSHRPNDSTPDQKAETAESMADATQSVKLGRLAELERELIKRTLIETRGNMSEAARILGIDRRTLYRKVSAPAAEQSPAEHVEPSAQKDPWLTLGLLRDDLKIVVALLKSGDGGDRELALRRSLKALHRVGDGELSSEGRSQ